MALINVDNKSQDTFDLVSPEIAEIKAKTDNLPTDPADESNIQDKLGTPANATISNDIELVRALSASSHTSGNFTYLDAGGEQDITSIATATRITIQGAWLDMVNITQSGVIKVYQKIDGTNYREVASFPFNPSTDSDGVFLNLTMGINHDFKLTYTEDSDEGANRVIPFYVMYDLRQQ